MSARKPPKLPKPPKVPKVIKPSIPAESTLCDFKLILLKGLVEHNDGTRYFGSTMGYRAHWMAACAAGYATGMGDSGDKATDLGQQVYKEKRLDLLPQTGRGYSWNWRKWWCELNGVEYFF